MGYSNDVHNIYTYNNEADDRMLVGNVVWESSHGLVGEGVLCTRAAIKDWAGEEPVCGLYLGRRAIFLGSWWCVDVVRWWGADTAV